MKTGRKTLISLSIAAAMASSALAAPGGKGGGKPDKPGEEEPSGPLELAFEEPQNDGSRIPTLSTLTLSNRQQVPLQPGIGGRLHDGHYLAPNLIRLLTADRYEQDQPLFTVDVNLDANGNILSANGRLLVNDAGNCRDLADDGSVAVYADREENLVKMISATGGTTWVAHSFAATDFIFDCSLLADGDGTYTLYVSLYDAARDTRIDRIDLNIGSVQTSNLTSSASATIVGPSPRYVRFINASPDQNKLVWDSDDYEVRIIDDLAGTSAPRLLAGTGEYSSPQFLCDSDKVIMGWREKSGGTIIYSGSGTQLVTRKVMWGRTALC